MVIYINKSIGSPPSVESGERPTAFEVEVRAQHPEQIRRNYWKNARKNRQVVFVVPYEGVRKRVEQILKEIGAK